MPNFVFAYIYFAIIIQMIERCNKKNCITK